MTTKKILSSGNSKEQRPIPIQSKIIGVILLLVFTALSILWYVGKGKIQAFEKSLEDRAKSYGITLDKSPLEFSGFPFALKGTYAKFKAFQQGTSLLVSASPLEISTSFWRPSHITIKGPVTYGVYGKNDVLFMGIRFEKAVGNISQQKDGSTSLMDIKAYDVDLIRGESAQKLVSFKKIGMGHSEKAEGNLTRLGGFLEGTGITVADAPSALRDLELKIEGTIASPYKTNDALTKAIMEFNNEFREALRKKCVEKAEFMPSLKEVIASLENSKSSTQLLIKIKGPEYSTLLQLDGKVKNGFPEIVLNWELKNVDKFLEAAVESELLDTSIARSVPLFLANIAKEEKGTHKVILSLENRELKLGDKPIFSLKDVEWDRLKLPVQYCEQLVEQKEGTSPSSSKPETSEGLVGLAAPVA